MDFSAPNLTLSKKTANTTMYSCALQRVVRLGSEASAIKDICQLATCVSMPGSAEGWRQSAWQIQPKVQMKCKIRLQVLLTSIARRQHSRSITGTCPKHQISLAGVGSRDQLRMHLEGRVVGAPPAWPFLSISHHCVLRCRRWRWVCHCGTHVTSASKPPITAVMGGLLAKAQAVRTGFIH